MPATAEGFCLHVWGCSVKGLECNAGAQHSGGAVVGAGAAAALRDVAAGHRDPRVRGRSLARAPGLAAGAPPKLAVRMVAPMLFRCYIPRVKFR